MSKSKRDLNDSERLSDKTLARIVSALRRYNDVATQLECVVLHVEVRS